MKDVVVVVEEVGEVGVMVGEGEDEEGAETDALRLLTLGTSERLYEKITTVPRDMLGIRILLLRISDPRIAIRVFNLPRRENAIEETRVNFPMTSRRRRYCHRHLHQLKL